MFLTGIVAVLTRYPQQVVDEVTDLGSGVHTLTGFIPTPKDVRSACEKAMEPIRRQMKREEIERDSKRLLGNAAHDDDRLTYDGMIAKYGPNWGIGHNFGPCEEAYLRRNVPTSERAYQSPSWDDIRSKPSLLGIKQRSPEQVAEDARQAEAFAIELAEQRRRRNGEAAA